MSSRFALKKLVSDLREVQTGDYSGQFDIKPSDNTMFHWTGDIYGPQDTPYANAKFKIDIAIPDTYPNVPPLIKFVTKVFHPNIDKTGQICLNILRAPPNGDWKPCINLPKVVLSVHSLLSDPNPMDPLNTEAGNMYKADPVMFFSTAREWTTSYAEIY
jgi:ubiquitin-protein ligase